jgi:hypothetical protein
MRCHCGGVQRAAIGTKLPTRFAERLRSRSDAEILGFGYIYAPVKSGADYYEVLNASRLRRCDTGPYSRYKRRPGGARLTCRSP